MIKILELFGGIGAPRKALERMEVPIKSIDYVEILPNAVASYNRLFDNNYKTQDIKEWNMKVDLLIHGSPCQDWSNNGLNNMATGRSILYERTLEIIKHDLHPKPKVVIWENVTGLISKRHKHHFEHYLESMTDMGYTNHYQVLNAKDYGIPQERKRVFVVSVLNNLNFKFPTPNKNVPDIKNYIDHKVDFEKYKLSDNEMQLFFYENSNLYIRENNSKGKRIVEEYDVVNIERPTSKTRRGRLGKRAAKTLTTAPNQAIYYNGRIRRLTAKEHWLLMGFDESDFNKVLHDSIKESHLYQLAGNSIVVQVLEAIFEEVLSALEEDKRCKQ